MPKIQKTFLLKKGFVKVTERCTRLKLSFRKLLTLLSALILFIVFNGKEKEKLPTGVKFILLWSPQNFAPFTYLGNGQEAFIRNNCSIKNCYITEVRNLLPLTHFDAIAFNGRCLPNKVPVLPKVRSSHQIYIYFNLEAPTYFPVRNSKYDGFFNWTATYRLDSDIPYPYILIKNSHGDVVGPKVDMKWEDSEESHNLLSYNISKEKHRAVAYFVSNCRSKSGREFVAKKLKKELLMYNLTLDIYGRCGHHVCRRTMGSVCDTLLKKYYYFYLSFENSFDRDYVTEKLLRAVLNDVVPIVYGGADYSRFLPPGSYLDARKHSPRILASTIFQAIRYPELYQRFFNWRHHYTYHDAKDKENVCSICAHLNNETLINKTKVYNHFRKWWRI